MLFSSVPILKIKFALIRSPKKKKEMQPIRQNQSAFTLSHATPALSPGVNDSEVCVPSELRDNRKYTLVSAPCFWHRAPQTLALETSFVLILGL